MIRSKERDKREERGAERDRRWHWQTKCYDPAAPKLPQKDLKAGITAGQKGRLFFSCHLQRDGKKGGENSQ